MSFAKSGRKAHQKNVGVMMSFAKSGRKPHREPHHWFRSVVMTIQERGKAMQKVFDAQEMSAKVQAMLEKEPNLSMFGFGVFGQEKLSKKEYDQKLAKERREIQSFNSLRVIFLTMLWIEMNLKQVGEINRLLSSYSLKHVAEKKVGYLTNGQFIVAIHLCGYQWIQRGNDAYFNGEEIQ